MSRSRRMTMRRGPFWFSGSADAIYQNLNLVHDEKPDIVCVFGADHIYPTVESALRQIHPPLHTEEELTRCPLGVSAQPKTIRP